MVLTFFGNLLIPRYLKYLVSKAKENVLKKVEELQNGDISKLKNAEIKSKLLNEGVESKDIDMAIAMSILKTKTKNIERTIPIASLASLFIIAEYFLKPYINETILNIFYIIGGICIIYIVFIKKSNKK